MRISNISIRNFRLLENVDLCLEDGTTLIIGRNNSGKTSLTELFRRLLDEKSPRFRLEDFSLGMHEFFWQALELQRNNGEDNAIRDMLPTISVELSIEYTQNEDLGPLTEFVIDLDDTCTTAKVVVTYALAAGKIEELYEDIGDDRQELFRSLRERLPKCFVANIEAEDPNDPTNRKRLEPSDLRAVLQFGFSNAQRALDDATNKEKAVLGKVFERLFAAASSATAGDTDQTTATTLKTAVEHVQSQIDEDFNEQLGSLAPTFDLFGYPGLSDPQLRTETVLNVEQLLSNHTTVGYEGPHGVKLPESYNGLGPRNLIFILLKLFEFFREFTTRQPESGIHLIFIEEPEAHLHPQMQAVFIRKLAEIRAVFEATYNGGNPWPVQFVVTTHSSHIANEASFDAMRYFLATPREEGSTILRTETKDLRTGLSEELPANREFLHKYMTLTRCDLLFADGAVLVEGTTERLLLPKLIEKFDVAAEEGGAKLGSKYITIMEVGGAYSHLFFNLLDFLNLRSLIITDLDSTREITNENGQTKWKKCKVSEGYRSSNTSINRWFFPDGGDRPALSELLEKTTDEKLIGCRRISYQIPHIDGDACGRSFEDAFILANPGLFGITGATPAEREAEAWERAKGVDKTAFALTHAIQETNWTTPKYIAEGLQWLAGPWDEQLQDVAEQETGGGETNA